MRKGGCAGIKGESDERREKEMRERRGGSRDGGWRDGGTETMNENENEKKETR